MEHSMSFTVPMAFCFACKLSMQRWCELAPAIDLVSKLFPVGMILTDSKEKCNYHGLWTKVSELNNFDVGHLTELGCDMEHSLFTECKTNWLTSVAILFCFFHVMQAWIKNLGAHGLKRCYKKNWNFRLE
eukprot:714258_1